MTTRAASAPTSLRSALLWPAVSGFAGIAAVALLHARDPHDAGSYGVCPFLSLTGWPCPGCGGLRAVNDLTHGDVVAAASSNVLAVVFVAGAVALWIVWFARRVAGQQRAAFITVGLRAAMLAGVVIVVFGVLRNTPWGSWLAP